MRADDIEHIYRDGRHYDRLFGEPCISFWMEIAERAGGSILELGCGTGRIAIPIAESGFEVVGIDSSENMLTYAREKVDGKDLGLQFIHSDMRAFSMDRKFDLIILPSNNLCHLLTCPEADACFQNVAAHLVGGGLFVVDVFVPDLNILSRGSDNEEGWAEYEDPDGRGQVRVTATATYDEKTQIREISTRRQISGYPDHVGHLKMRMYFPQELDGLLRDNGFAIEEKFGGYESEPFSEKSAKQIIIAGKG